MSQELERSLPHSADAEKAVLGLISLNNAHISEAIELLDTQDFYLPSHRKIYPIMIRLFECGSEINHILIAEELQKDNALESVGGMTYLMDLTYGLPHASSIKSYARIVRGKSLMRRLIMANAKSTQQAIEGEDDYETVLEDAGKGVFELFMEQTTSQFEHIAPIVHRSVQKAHAIKLAGNTITGVTSGYPDLDSLTRGWQPQDLIILAARPTVGKTAFSLMLTENAVKNVDAAVAIFSLEMSKDSLAERMLCAEARVDGQRFRQGFMNQEEEYRIEEAEHLLAGRKIYLEDAPGLTPLKLRAKAKRLIMQHGKLDLIVVDYLGLMSGSGKRYESRRVEIGSISRELKGLAKELNLPLIALSQLNRAPEGRTDHRPTLADLRDSGDLEQDADVVTFIYRPAMYLPKPLNDEDVDNTAEIIVAKQRNGPTDTVRLRFDPPTGRFDSLYQA